jgi:hypothetical protein
MDKGRIATFGWPGNAKNTKELLTSNLLCALMAVLGSVFLIAPMLIAVLHDDQVTALVATSVYVCVWIERITSRSSSNS